MTIGRHLKNQKGMKDVNATLVWFCWI